jgi:hypothetical protein
MHARPLSTPLLRIAERTNEVMSIVSMRVVVRTSKISVTDIAHWYHEIHVGFVLTNDVSHRFATS